MFCARCGIEELPKIKNSADRAETGCKSFLQPLIKTPRFLVRERTLVIRAADGIGMMGALTLAAALAFAVIMGLISEHHPNNTAGGFQ